MNAIAKTNDANSEKAKALAAALAQIEKQFGKGTIMKLGEGEAIEDIQVVSTGSWVWTSRWAWVVCPAAA
jgi:recombination protein RecA